MADNRFHGMYRGEVIDDLDPFEAGRVKIYVFGVYDDIGEENLPWAIYSDPWMGGQEDLGGMFVPDVGSHVWVFFEQGRPELPVYFAGAPARPDGPREAREVGQYPRNKVFKTMSGHVLEFDDSPGETRIRIAHNSGTQKTYAHNGDSEEVITGNMYIFVEGDAETRIAGNETKYVEGNVTEYVEGNVTEYIKGNFITNVYGRRKEVSAHGSEYHTQNGMNITGRRIDLNKGGGAAIEQTAGQFTYTPEYAYSFGAAADLVSVTGSNAPFDTPEDADMKEEAMDSGEFPTETETAEEGDDVATEDQETPPVDDSCPTIEGSVYTTPIGGAGKTVADYTINTVFPHRLREQKGLTQEQLVCNAHHLFLNICDPIMAQFPELRINSGFRVGNGGSQHNIAEAVDFQSTRRPSDKAFHREVLDWIASNLPYDQCIIETSNGVTYWIHISYSRNSAPRKERLTYRNKKYTGGWNV